MNQLVGNKQIKKTNKKQKLTMYSLIKPCLLSGGFQETFTVPSLSLSQVSCRFLGGSGTEPHQHININHDWYDNYWVWLIKESKWASDKSLDLATIESIDTCATHIPQGSWLWSYRWSCGAFWGTEWEPSHGRWCLVSAQWVCSWFCCCGSPWWPTAGCPQASTQKDIGTVIKKKNI